jgi:hypothetical protein
LRYRARPPFALERIEPVNQHRVGYHALAQPESEYVFDQELQW